MTMAGQIRMITFPKSRDVMIAGVAWPLYKVSALVVGLAVAVVVGVVTATAAPAVLAGAATAAVMWLAFGFSHRPPR
jgi:hypothetical protein